MCLLGRLFGLGGHHSISRGEGGGGGVADKLFISNWLGGAENFQFYYMFI